MLRNITHRHVKNIWNCSKSTRNHTCRFFGVGRKHGATLRRTPLLAGRMSSRICAMPSDVFVLELDGVLVDCFREKAKCACHAAHRLHPQHVPLNILEHEALIETLSQIDRLHSVKASEQIIILKTLAEFHSLEETLTVQDILDLNLNYDLSQEELLKAFQDARNVWIKEEEKDWLSMITPYPGVQEALSTCSYPVYFATCTTPEISSLIFRKILEQDIASDSPRLFTSSTGSKLQSMKTITSRPLCQEASTRLHFIDSSVDTMKEMKGAGLSERWKFYYASWGWQDEQRRSDASGLGAKILELKELSELLKWGMVMGVDDGCEPTPEEVQEQVKTF